MIYPLFAVGIVLSIYSIWAWYTNNDTKYISTFLTAATFGVVGYLFYTKEYSEIEGYENEKVSLEEIKEKVDTIVNSS